MREASRKIASSGKKIKQRYERYTAGMHNGEILLSDEEIIQTVIRIESVRIDRNDFLTRQFAGDASISLDDILEKGPVGAGYDRGALRKTAVTLAQKETGKSGLLDIPDDVIKNCIIPYQTLLFYAAAVRMIQQIAYLYGENDFWTHTDTDLDKTVSRLNLYYRVMSGSDKATKALKLLSSSAASKSFNKITENLIEKTYRPIVKPAAKMLGVRMHKSVFDRLVSKAVPVTGNTISQGLTLASLFPMAGRLIKTLDEAQFAYSTYDFEADWYDITNESEAKKEEATPVSDQNVET